MRKNIALLALLMLCCKNTYAAEVAEEARKIVDTYKDTVVSVQLVLQMSYGGASEKRETKLSCTATIVDPSGLVVTSLSSVNPADVFRGLSADEDEEFKITSRIVDAKIKCSDGTEIPADIVLRDRDLDLAFLRPKKPVDTPLPYVDLSKAGNPQLLDELVVLNRLGQVASRTIAVSIDRIQAIVTKPRTFYVVGGTSTMGFGYPSFCLDGKPAGLLVLRIAQTRDDSEGLFSMFNRMLPVVLPASTVQKLVEQAKTAAPVKEEDNTKPAPKSGTKPNPKTPEKPPSKSGK